MRTTAKATPASLRRRLAKIHAQAEELTELVRRWDPKGRHFVTQRELLAAAPKIVIEAAHFLRRLETPKISQKRLARGLVRPSAPPSL